MNLYRLNRDSYILVMAQVNHRFWSGENEEENGVSRLASTQKCLYLFITFSGDTRRICRGLKPLILLGEVVGCAGFEPATR